MTHLASSSKHGAPEEYAGYSGSVHMPNGDAVIEDLEVTTLFAFFNALLGHGEALDDHQSVVLAHSVVGLQNLLNEPEKGGYEVVKKI